jgi:predicted ribosome quality control (RQC) complex YloA/Tae2 family protein
MTTDWILIRRAATELEHALRGGRVTDLGLLDDGRIAVRFGGMRARAAVTLAIDAFGSPPLVSLEEVELALAVDPGWLRTISTTLRGMRFGGAQGRRGDRVLVLTFGTASRFGVESEARLVLELVPRYGNVVLLRDRLVIAAAKQFSPAENEARAVQVGLPYEPPPLPAARLDFAGFTRALEGADEAALTRALGGYLPELPRLLAATVAAAAVGVEARSAAQLATWLEDRARSLLAAAELGAGETGPVRVYRDARGAPLAAHVVPLTVAGAVAETEAATLLEVFAEARASVVRVQRGDATERRRSALQGRIVRRLQATDGEARAVRARLDAAAERDRLRESGDALYTHANEIAPRASSFVPATNPSLTIPLDPALDAKQNAQRYYVRYRKAADALPHLERRRAALAARREALDVLAFEVERSDPPTLGELEAALDVLEGRPPQRVVAPGRRRAPLRIERPSGARISVGRSPRENEEVTFRIARPDDLWFHARGIPGSHVVLQAAPGAAFDEADLDAAADLAALHSKGRAGGRIEVDYTERKYVRKQRDGAAGLVWYTNARTRLGRPDQVPAETASRNAATTRGS